MGSTQVGIVRDLAKFPPQDPSAKKELYNAALELLYSTESAQDTAQRLYHGHVPLAIAQTGIDLNLFNILAEQQDKECTLEQLAEKTKAEPALLHHILRCLNAYGMVVQTKVNTFTGSNITKNLALPSTHAGIKHQSVPPASPGHVVPRVPSKARLPKAQSH